MINKNCYHWIILTCGVLMVSLNIGHTALLNPLMPFLKESIGLNYAQISKITTTRTFFALLATMITDNMFDKVGFRMSVATSFCSAILSCIFFGIASGLTMCLVAAAFSGFAFGLGGMIPASLLMRRWFKDNRGAAIGICSAGSGIASMTLAAPLAKLAKHHGLLFAEGALAAIIAMGAVLFILLVRERPEDVGQKPYEKEPRESLLHRVEDEENKSTGLMSNSHTALLMSAVICIGFMTFCSWENFSMAATSVGYDSLFISTIIGFEGLASIIGRSLYGVGSDKLGTVRTNYIYFTLLIMAHGMFLLMDGATKFFVYITVFAMGGCCYAISTVGMPIWASELFDEKHSVSMLKRLQGLSTAGGILMGPIPGLLADAYGNYKPFYFFEGLCLAYSLFAVQFVYFHRKQRPRLVLKFE